MILPRGTNLVLRCSVKLNPSYSNILFTNHLHGEKALFHRTEKNPKAFVCADSPTTTGTGIFHSIIQASSVKRDIPRPQRARARCHFQVLCFCLPWRAGGGCPALSYTLHFQTLKCPWVPCSHGCQRAVPTEPPVPKAQHQSTDLCSTRRQPSEHCGLADAHTVRQMV